MSNSHPVSLKINERLFPVNPLENILSKLSIVELCKLYGEEELELIGEIFSQKITPMKIVGLLLQRHGNQILANKSIRLAIWSKLSQDRLGYILDGKRVFGRQLSESEFDRLFNSNWGRRLSITQRTLHELSLDDSYLPPVSVVPVTVEVLNANKSLFPHQRRLKDQLTRFLLKGEKRVLMHMPTGAGKTRTSLEAVIDFWRTAADRRGCIVWLAHSEELCDQAIESFRSLWGDRGDEPIKLVRFWGNHMPDGSDLEGAFVVAGLPKIVSVFSSDVNDAVHFSGQIMKRAQIVVMDEAHKAMAPTYKMVLQNLIGSGQACLVGLTATPGRGTRLSDEDAEDSESRRLVKYFHNNKLGLVHQDMTPIESPIEYLQSEGFLARLERTSIKTNVSLELTRRELEFVQQYLDLPGSVLERLASNASRNALILSQIMNLVESGRQIIVFGLSVRHANFLSDLLRLQGFNARCITGETPMHDRQAWIEKYKRSELNILVNYGVLTTGFDAPNTNAIVICRPTASVVLYSQMIGRAIRGPKVGGNEVATLVDLEDNIAGFPSEALAFNYFDDLWN